MAKKIIKKNDNKIEEFALKLGIKKENLEKGLKVDKKKTEEMIHKAAKFMGMK